MGTDLLLQLDADNAAPIRDDVASTARVQAITQGFELVLLRYIARLQIGLVSAADMTRGVRLRVSLRCFVAASTVLLLVS